MIRCSAFCISLSDRAARVAASSAGNVDRIRTRVSVIEGVGGQGKDLVPVLTALQLGEDAGLPVVHGFVGESRDTGEYSMVTEEGGTLEVVRDMAGTRPLFVGEFGDWIASDHRFFRGEGLRLLSPGVRYEVLGGRIHAELRSPVVFAGDFEEAAEAVARNVDQCVRERVQGKRKVGVAFSGGLDSSILASCASRYSKVVACSVHSAHAHDKVKAADAAKVLGLEFEARELDRQKANAELSSLDLPFEPVPMDRSLWCIYSVAARAASEAGAELIMLGQLADELFGGYAKYERAARDEGPARAEVMMETDVADCGMHGLIRDEMACSRWLEPRFPFADGRVLRLARSMPVGYRLMGGVRKSLLREAARRLGVPDELAMSPKKAAQYSSGVLRLVR